VLTFAILSFYADIQKYADRLAIDELIETLDKYNLPCFSVYGQFTLSSVWYSQVTGILFLVPLL